MDSAKFLKLDKVINKFLTVLLVVCCYSPCLKIQAATSHSAEVDEVIKRVMAIDNVTRYVIYNREGVVLRYEGWPASEVDGGYKKCVQLAGALSTLVQHSSKECQEYLAPPHVSHNCMLLYLKPILPTRFLFVENKNRTM